SEQKACCTHTVPCLLVELNLTSMRRMRRRLLKDLYRIIVCFFFFKQKTAYDIGLGIPAEPLFRSTLILNTFLFGVIILIANILKRAFSSQLAAKLRNRLLVL